MSGQRIAARGGGAARPERRSRLRVVSYNIHCGIGRDRRFAPRRIRDVLAEIDADLVALQEVESRASGADMLALLAAETGLRAVAGPTLVYTDGYFGNALLTRCPIVAAERLDLGVAGCEPRCAIAADIDCTGRRLRIVATHLGLRRAERREQVQRLLGLFDGLATPAVLAGDLNEWLEWSRPLRRLRAHFSPTPAPATFPAGLPAFALDRVWAHPRSILTGVAVHASALARVASDHLPLVATLEL